ncbi:MAG: hypothetical protein ACRDK3_15030 [Actinomycetota bacterium]
MRNRLALLAALCGAVAGIGTWLAAPAEQAAGIAPLPSAGRPTDAGVVRHVVERPGVGTAFVEDRPGADLLRVTIGGDSKTAPTSGEVTNPAISESGSIAWAEDHSTIKLWDPHTDELTSLGRPQGTTAVFSPAFVTEDQIASVAQEPVPGVPGEDDGLNNLFEVDAVTGDWTALTAFEGRPDDWTALRTPVVAPAGDVLFVRVRGDSQATVPPTFELWSAGGEEALKIAQLPGEMYLAGFQENTRLWNAPSEFCDDWGLYEETANGLDRIGCGAVLADPLDAVDPDLEHEQHSDFAAPVGHAHGELGVMVGDFGSRAEAAAVAARMDQVAGLRVATHDSMPHAVAPGAWVVVRPVAPGISPEAALETVRRELPDLAGTVFIGPLGE